MANDPRKHLASTCQKKQAFKAGAFGFLSGVLPPDSAVGGFVSSIEAGFGTVVATANESAAGLNSLINSGVDGISDTVLGPGGANVGGSAAVRGILSTVSQPHTNAVNAASSNILELANIGELSDANILNHTKAFSDAAELLNNISASSNLGDEAVTCSASPYATDLIALGIKMKHLFVVEFEFYPAYALSLGALATAGVIKQCDRPTVTFEYEDVNLYNYRTKIATKTTHNTINMTFYDDERGNALGFYDMYHRSMSPIANVWSPDDILTWDQSMEFSNENLFGAQKPLYNNTAAGIAPTRQYASSLGPLSPSNGVATKQLLKTIKIFHVYKAGGVMDVYTLLNPRVMEMQLDELTMEESGINQLTLQLSYDSFFLETGFSPASDSYGSVYGETYDLEMQSSAKDTFKHKIVHHGQSILQKSPEEQTAEQIEAAKPGGIAGQLRSAFESTSGAITDFFNSGN